MSVLGIDIGTTNIKITIVNESTQRKIFSSAKPNFAYIPTRNALIREQCPRIIFKTLDNLLKSVDKDMLQTVNYVSVCCQMHGVVFWNSTKVGSDEWEMSNLVTWEDQRCDDNFLKQLPKGHGINQISSGFGIATIFWLLKHDPDFFSHWDNAGTIGDLLVARLCQLKKAVISPQNAASWGYFDVTEMRWELDTLAEFGFPVNLLPSLSQCGDSVGVAQESLYGIPIGCTVYPALGDLQASVFACVQFQEGKAVVNVGTSSQFALISASPPVSSIITTVPYFGPLRLAVAASLNGGNVLSCLVDLLKEWTIDLGVDPPESSTIWERLSYLADKADDTRAPIIRPTLFGERYMGSEVGAVVEGLRAGSGLSLGAVYQSLCRGLMANLLHMAEGVKGVEEVLGTGSALVKNRTLRTAFIRTFAEWKPRMMTNEPDASFGAALAVVCGHGNS